jgi:DnaJ-domain-containing protein 1
VQANPFNRSRIATVLAVVITLTALLLGISKGANDDEIKRAYRRLAKKYHPDQNKDNKQAVEQFQEALKLSSTDVRALVVAGRRGDLPAAHAARC